MFSVNVRKIMGAFGGLILGCLFAIFALNLLNWTAANSSQGARTGLIVVFIILGVLAGLIFEKRTRAYYYKKMEGLPPGENNPLGRAFATGQTGKGMYIAAIIYIFYKFAILAGLFLTGTGITSTIRYQLIFEAIFEAVLFFVSLRLYIKWRDGASSGLKKITLVAMILFAIIALGDVTALIVLKPFVSTALVPVDGSSAYQAIPLTSFQKTPIASLNGYQSSTSYFIEIDGTIDEPSIPDTANMFSVTDQSGGKAYVSELNQGTTTFSPQMGDTITIYGVIWGNSGPISPSSSALIEVKACAPSGISAPEFFCG